MKITKRILLGLIEECKVELAEDEEVIEIIEESKVPKVGGNAKMRKIVEESGLNAILSELKAAEDKLEKDPENKGLQIRVEELKVKAGEFTEVTEEAYMDGEHGLSPEELMNKWEKLGGEDSGDEEQDEEAREIGSELEFLGYSCQPNGKWVKLEEESKDDSKEFVITLDWALDEDIGDDNLTNFKKQAEKCGVKPEILSLDGPGAGWPEVSITGTKEKLKKFVLIYTGENDGGEADGPYDTQEMLDNATPVANDTVEESKGETPGEILAKMEDEAADKGEWSFADEIEELLSEYETETYDGLPGSVVEGLVERGYSLGYCKKCEDVKEEQTTVEESFNPYGMAGGYFVK